ncbi:hypothetical protein ACN27E_18620 [Mycobacterium sp. WMMD1722]|uniref:hypothetical protein n=1 Tax=Mycobacterium sp. WMMD1722 TaxID=3404117 RepID=UPI003BF54A59
MMRAVRLFVGAALCAGSLTGVGVVLTPAVSGACLPGETGVTNGCAPFCLPGKYLDMSTGLCTPAPFPVPPGSGPLPPAGVIPPSPY